MVLPEKGGGIIYACPASAKHNEKKGGEALVEEMAAYVAGTEVHGGGKDGKKRLTPMKAIRKKCLDCSNGQFNKVKGCPIEKCPLYYFRLGHNPIRTERV